jgi:uncharacterized membrane protein
MQGVVSGCSLAAGYGIGELGRWLWVYVEFPKPKGRFVRVARLAAVIGSTAVAFSCLWQMTQWQNSIRKLMELDPVETAHPLGVVLIALAVFALLMLFVRFSHLTLRFTAGRLNRFLPGRISRIIGVIAAVLLSWSIIDGLLFRTILRVADASYREMDKLIEPEIEQPTAPLKTGSSDSLLAWHELGRRGREFIAAGPTRENISAFSGKRSLEPIRVYVGLRSADSLEGRVNLALEELKRVGGFDRSALIVVTPTGTGWVDPAAMDSVEYLHRGDVASIALQYSYVGSWLYRLTGTDYGADAARALFREIYGHWTMLPRNERPKLYLQGLSLGASHSQASMNLIEVLGDPFSGALWSGPPSTSSPWDFFTDHRNPDSSAWLPRFGDGSVVRFMNQDGPASDFYAAWGPTRLVYLQYASDPVTFFEYRGLYREPDWMQPPRGPDVSPQFRWYPVVTFLQLAADKFMATAAPIGFGHVYAPAHYIDAWIQVTDVRDWSSAEVARLKQHLSKP